MAPQRIFDPFLLPVCDCGGATMLASCEPHLRDSALEVKTYRCAACGAENVELARRARRASKTAAT